MKEGRDVWWHDSPRRSASEKSRALAKTPPAFDAEHPLFILYTSGSTGKPKGVQHTTAGYLAGVHVTSKYVFDLATSDLYWCTADVGWVTGHSYVVYGPLSCGASCMMYEGAPNFPDSRALLAIIERHGVTILYTAPTAIRAFIRGATSGRRSTTSDRCASSGRSVSPSIRRRGPGTTASSAEGAAPSSTRGGRPRRVRSC
jgi:acetyl-CoA synthetase